MEVTIPTPTFVPELQERAFLVGAELKSGRPLLAVEDSLAELTRLASTAGLVVVGQTYQRFDHPHQATFIGPGKVDEVKHLVNELEADVVVFDDELSPRHQRELENAFGEKVKVLDRTALILDIFAQHAHTREGMLQVELAQLEYRLPRLTRMWTHLARQTGKTGGGVGVRGPGEMQIEIDRRLIRQRIAFLEKQLEQVRAHRSRHRQQRRQTELLVVAIVGYTNAGKSTLLNCLSGADVYSADMLFATLDPTTRRVKLPGGRELLFTDTVGFIQKLPTQIVAAFRATLEEIGEADILLHVVDATHPHAQAQIEAVEDTLAELEVEQLPTIIALNKCDLLPEGSQPLAQFELAHPTVAISAATGAGIAMLLTAVEAATETYLTRMWVRLPFERGDLLSLFHERGQVDFEEHTPTGIVLRGRLPTRLAAYFQDYLDTKVK